MKHLLFLAALASFALNSCVDVVRLDVPEAAPQLAVDGRITDQPIPAAVRLSLTQAYFNGQAPPVVRGAVVLLADDLGRTDTLRETAPGQYRGRGTVRGRVGGRYSLSINANGQTYRADTEIRRTPPIDSIGLEFKLEQTGFDEGWYGFYYGPELPGVGDFYRFKAFKNGVAYNQPGDLIVRADELVDGRYLDGIELNLEPLKTGDRFKVELQSIPRDYFFFLNEMTQQINNVGLFATSPANVRTNVRNTRPGAGAAAAAVGYFAGYTVRTDSVVVR